MSTFSPRLAARALTAAALVLLLGGCAGGNGPSTVRTPLPTPTVSATATATATATAPPVPMPTVTETVTATPQAAVTPAREPSTSRCTGSDLTMEYRPDPGASGAGSSAFDLVLTNVSSSACTLAGIPGVYAIDASGTRISAVADASGPNPPGLIEVASGARADVRVASHSPGAYGCTVGTSAALVAEVLDADDGAVRAPAELEVCTDGTVMMDASAYRML
ncbi:DUF4232 domain-containing protein [Rathayibacter tritici]|uniref:DUF4232 domain-containing protein n=1 Tax=Rathayibacter tritici TaxID=33888 RepID=UPI0014761477|nr:DUF4232 domain-containing protein [Rathayibacter tritici]